MKPVSKRNGRPLSFNRAAALKQAMLAFWRHGYETTSVAELTAAMGITAPSLYTAFGDKEQLFLEAMSQYSGEGTAITAALEAAPSARAGVAQMLDEAATAFTGVDTPQGCLLASSTASGSETSRKVQAAVADVRADVTARVRVRVEADIDAGILDRSTQPQALADMVIATIQGMSVLARDGVPRQRLLALSAIVLAAFTVRPRY